MDDFHEVGIVLTRAPGCLSFTPSLWTARHSMFVGWSKKRWKKMNEAHYQGCTKDVLFFVCVCKQALKCVQCRYYFDVFFVMGKVSQHVVIASKRHHYWACPQTSSKRHPLRTTRRTIRHLKTSCGRKKNIYGHNTLLCMPNHRAPLLLGKPPHCDFT